MNRKHELSLLNIVFCLIVIFIHIASAPVTGLDRQSVAYAVVFLPWRLSAFVVQGFIFLSGVKMFLGFGKKVNYKKYYLSRAEKIVIPYLISVCLFYLYFVWRNYFGFSLSELIGYAVKGDLVSHFYFVIIIVQFYLLRPLWEVMVRRASPAAAIGTALVITIAGKVIGQGFVYNDRIFTTYLIYWVIGCYAGAYYELFKEKISKYHKGITAAFCVIAAAEAVFSYMHFTGRTIAFIEQLHFVYAVCAIAFCVVISLRLGDTVMNSSLMQKIDGASYYIYLVHPLVIFEADRLIDAAGITAIDTAFILRGIAAYVVTISVCIAYVQMKKVLVSRGK